MKLKPMKIRDMKIEYFGTDLNSAGHYLFELDRGYIGRNLRKIDTLPFNPEGLPYSCRNGKSKWLDKMYSHGNGIALLPDSTSSDWWQRAAKQSACILFLKDRIKFVYSDGTIGKQPANGSCLFAYGDKAIMALVKAEINGLGIILKR